MSQKQGDFEMKRLIDGRLFDTEEMDVIAEITLSGEYHTDFDYHAVTIFVDKDDNFFKCKYCYPAGDNELEIMSRQEVIEWCEEVNYDMDDDELLICLGLI